jgi:hypothetical protein
MTIKWIPVRPDGLLLGWLMADSERAAWDKLMLDDEYFGKARTSGEYKALGFRVEEYEVVT